MENGWSEEDLEKIAEKIRQNLVGEHFSLEQITYAAKHKNLRDIGFFYVWIVKNEKRMLKYLPNEVVRTISDRISSRLNYDKLINDFFRNNCWRGAEFLCSRLYITRKAVRRRATKLGVKLPRLSIYSQLELSTVASIDIKEVDDDTIMQTLGIQSKNRVYRLRRRVGKLRRITYSWDKNPKSLEYLKANYLTQSAAQIAEDLGLTINQIEKKAWNEGLIKRY